MVNKYLWKEGAREERDLQRQINLPVFDPYQVTPQTGKVFLDRLSPDAGLTFFRWSTEGQRDQDSRCSSEARAAAWAYQNPEATSQSVCPHIAISKIHGFAKGHLA